MSDEVNQMLSNLEAIKDGQDPRASESESTSAQPVNTETTPVTHESVVEKAQAELEATFEKYPFLTDHLQPEQCHVYVANWKRRRGLCSYNKIAPAKEFGKRVTKDEFSYKSGNFAIGVARRIIEDDHDWDGTIRHEITHAYLYEKHGESQKHNQKFKNLNQRLNGSSKAKHKRKDYNYSLSCPNGCFSNGFMRRSKKIQKPWTRSCLTCESSCVSHDYDEPVPDEPGVCTVESIDWDDKSDWYSHDTRSI